MLQSHHQQQQSCHSTDEQTISERASDTAHSDDEDNEICVVETDDKPCSSDDSYTHLTSGKFLTSASAV
jgi:hypothetical protein